MTSAPGRRAERPLRAVQTSNSYVKHSWNWVFRACVLLFLGLIIQILSKPTALDKCIERRYQQVLTSHKLNSNEIPNSIRISELNKATNFCQGGSGLQQWNH